jgi:hypothetical protein
MTEKSLEEQADELLAEWAREQGESLRDLGVLDDRRLRTVRAVEIPMSSVYTKHRTGVLKDDSFEEDE